jgi:PhnB protein
LRGTKFYHKALGAEVTALMRFKESPDPDMCPAGAEDKVMHATVRIGNTTIMASDGHYSTAASRLRRRFLSP